MELTPKQRQHLKALAHPLKPVVMLGNNGLTEGVLAEIDQALEHHELIKVKAPIKDRELKEAVFETIAQQTGATKVQQIGHVLVFYRPAKEPVIRLPR
ncbi:ribosome assembly RNA-binding protein YhbY [Gallaecimonas kandeliae]|uniref:ribosome assembly RNA-binding protein YhbY n=1 Tax=Gallaecimonas kandeliae TaxID=3029055 RepID=UPI002649E52B|nr:ribosome assembly RNA-binding protein YhbY [Gallaecimonas kandeliae]WKE66593.1 ribosome assembly RNA-binding protein YhbY [Gallaecimonas kandeliae]